MFKATVNKVHLFDVDLNAATPLINQKAINQNTIVLPNGNWQTQIENKNYAIVLEKLDVSQKEITLKINGNTYTTTIKEPIDQLLDQMGINLKAELKTAPIKAPMPGMVLKIGVQIGQQVKKGDALLILEAMKMENMIKSPVDGVIKNIFAIEKKAVEKGTILIEME